MALRLPNFFRSAARGLHVPTGLTPEPTERRAARAAGPSSGRVLAAAKS
jgi:hypothetical protein